MPAVSPVIVLLVPVPVVVVPPGVLVNVHVPDAGNPFKITLPVERIQLGCVMFPTTGAVTLQLHPVLYAATTALICRRVYALSPSVECPVGTPW